MNIQEAIKWIKYNGDKKPPNINTERWNNMIKHITSLFENWSKEIKDMPTIENLKKSINPESVNTKDPYLVVNITKWRIVESWPTLKQSEYAVKVLNNHSKKENHGDVFGVICKDEERFMT